MPKMKRRRVMDFDKVIIRGDVEYGITVGGTSRLVFIKAGRGGSNRGYKDKYLKMAEILQREYECTVICASNPDAGKSDTDREIIEEAVGENKECEIYFIGSSDGGIKVTRLCADMSDGRRVCGVLLINMPLMINFNKTLGAFKVLENTAVTAVYGTRDPSAPYLKFLAAKSLPNVKIEVINGADHNFTDRLDEFISLARLVIKEKV